jgi:hypothetical protein
MEEFDGLCPSNSPVFPDILSKDDPENWVKGGRMPILHPILGKI